MPCTTILIGKDASIDGSTIIARDDDSGSGRYDPKKFVAVSPAEQPREYHSVLSHMTVPLPDDPCWYSIVPNVLPNRGVLAEAGVNEHNVAMSATETIAVNPRVLGADPFVAYQPAVGKPGEEGYRPEVPGGLGEEDIITLVLPYVATAREGVERFGSLLETYGTYEANGVVFSDVDEIWYVETIGGHHWIARRVPDDSYAAIPNQLGIDFFDADDALGERRSFMCSADLLDWMAANRLDRTISNVLDQLNVFNPRKAFGTATPKDHIYNTPRAWYMQRTLNPSADWDSPAAQYRPDSDDLPWCRKPDDKVTLEDVAFLMASHFEGTPYDPYGTTGTPESRHRFRPVGVNRTGHMVAMQIRPYAPADSRSLMWIAYGSQPFTAAAPFYANVHETPAYLRDTPGEKVSTDSLYWSNRLIAALADTHFFENDGLVEAYREEVQAYGHRHVAETDARLLRVAQAAGAGRETDADAAADTAAAGAGEGVLEPEGSGVAAPEAAVTETPVTDAPVTELLQEANEAMARFLEGKTSRLLFDVLYTSSNLMNNSFAMSDKWL